MKHLLYISLFLICQSTIAQQTVYLGISEYTLEKAKEEVAYICQKIGIQNTFYLEPFSSDGIAEAYQKGSRRMIAIDLDQMQTLYSEKGQSWATISVLLHEIGHHLNGDCLNQNGLNALRKEIDADYFLGFQMYLLGATLEQAKMTATLMPERGGILFKGTSYKLTHPPRRKRIETITKGYNAAKSNFQHLKKS